jgi:hypothetical protein
MTTYSPQELMKRHGSTVEQLWRIIGELPD